MAATSFFGGAFMGGEFFNVASDVAIKTGTGGIDPGEGIKRVPFEPFKPTGLLDRPKRKAKGQDPQVEGRVEDSASIAAEIAARLAREFGEETREGERAKELELSQAELDREIGMLLRKKLRTEEDEMLLLLLMAATAV